MSRGRALEYHTRRSDTLASLPVPLPTAITNTAPQSRSEDQSHAWNSTWTDSPHLSRAGRAQQSVYHTVQEVFHGRSVIQGRVARKRRMLFSSIAKPRGRLVGHQGLPEHLEFVVVGFAEQVAFQRGSGAAGCDKELVVRWLQCFSHREDGRIRRIGCRAHASNRFCRNNHW